MLVKRLLDGLEHPIPEAYLEGISGPVGRTKDTEREGLHPHTHQPGKMVGPSEDPEPSPGPQTTPLGSREQAHHAASSSVSA